MTTEANSPASSPLAIFSAAVERADDPARGAFIDLACRGDDELRGRVQEAMPRRRGTIRTTTKQESVT